MTTDKQAPSPDLDREQIERMLAQWANLPDDRSANFAAAIEKLRADYPGVCNDETGLALAQQIWAFPEDNENRWITGVREHLTAAWDAAAIKRYDAAKQRIFYLRRMYAELVHGNKKLRSEPSFEDTLREVLGERAEKLSETQIQQIKMGSELWKYYLQRGHGKGIWLEPLYPDTFFDAAMRHLETELPRALICLNSECPAPYFFRTVRGQKYCDPKGDCFREVRPKQQSASRESKRGRPAMRPGRPRKSRENQ